MEPENAENAENDDLAQNGPRLAFADVFKDVSVTVFVDVAPLENLFSRSFCL